MTTAYESTGASTATSSEFTARSSAVVFAATVGQMISGSAVSNSAFGLFLVPLVTAFGWSRQQFSIGLLIQSWTMALFFPLFGRLMDRYGTRKLLIPGTFLLPVVFVAMSLQSGSLFVFYILCFAAGLSAAATGPVPCAKVLSGWFNRRRGLVMSLSGLGLAFSALILPRYLQTIMSHTGWQGAFRGLSIYIVLLAIPLILLLRESEAAVQVRQKLSSGRSIPDEYGVNAKDAIRSRAFFLCALACSLSVLVNAGILAHVVALLRGRGLAPSDAFVFLTFAGIGMGVSRAMEGFLLDGINSPKIGAPFALMSFSGLLMLWLGNSPLMYLFAGLMFGIGIGGETSLMPYAISRFFGIRSFAQIYGVIWTVAALAAGTGPVFMGAVFDRTGRYDIGFMVFGSLLLVSCVCFVLLPGYRFKTHGAR